MRSRTTSQTTRVLWCGCHAAVAGYTLAHAGGASLAHTALSHLLFVDALGATLVAAVDILANFEAWRRASIRHPFGLARAEVLAGFALSVLLLFMGLDLCSHNLQHGLEGAGDHEPHVEHAHEALTTPFDGVAAGDDPVARGLAAVDSAALLAIAATLVSAFALDNHLRIGRAMRLSYFRNLPSILSNPAHCLTLACACLLLLLPLLGVRVVGPVDQLLASAAALAMVALGGRLVHRLGLMLLMSCPPAPSAAGETAAATKGGGNAESQGGRVSQKQRLGQIMRALEAEPLVTAVDALRVWQVHYGLCMAGVELRTRKGARDEERLRLRDRVAGLVRGRLGGGYGGGDGGGSVKWEVSTQMTPDN